MKRKSLITSFFITLAFISLADKSLKVHYKKLEDEKWNLWIWEENKSGSVYEFSEKDKFGDIANISLNDDVDKVGIIVRTDEWKKDIDFDRFIDTKSKDTEVYLLGKDENIYEYNPDERPKAFNRLDAVINFKNDQNSYRGYKVIVDNKEYKLRKNRSFGSSVFIRKEGENLKEIDFKILDDHNRLIYNNKITKFDNSGFAKVYLNEGDSEVYHDKEVANKPAEILDAIIDSLNTVVITMNKGVNLNKMKKNILVYETVLEYEMPVKSVEVINEANKYRLTFHDNFDLNSDFVLSIKNFEKVSLKKSGVVKSKEFDDMFYTNTKLGNIYDKDKTIFRVWAPTAKSVNLVTYKDDSETKYEMKLLDKGVYEYTLNGDNENLEYMYEVNFNDKTNLTQDPYAIASTVNSTHSVVVNVKELDSDFVTNDTKIIYELSIRDMTSQKDTDVVNKGKFLGLTEKNRTYDSKMKVGLDYIKDLGVTYVQVMPMYDFSTNSVDELDQFKKYNWGYDPVNYNVIEGSFSIDPVSKTSRILELQKFVKTMHDNNIGVIMDVVYNHVFDANLHAFNKIVPGYYFRLTKDGKYTNGTGVGNDIASEHKMVRKYIVDSVKYLANMYKLDGFRFDLMGILDIDTMNEVYKELKKINPNIVILGEGWNMGTLDENLRATQNNANKLENIAFFSDDMRDTVKGSTFGNIGKGFVNGKKDTEEYLVKNIQGGYGIRTYVKPSQVIQYVEAHDNLTLYDQLKRTNIEDDEATINKRHKLATTIILLSNGTPFIHSGQEFLRTKKGDENSYKSSDEINMIDYKRAYENKENIEYVKELIKIRKENKLFNLDNYEEILEKLNVIVKKDNVIVYKLSDGNKTYYVIYNANEEDIEVEIENGKYKVLVKDYKANSKGIEKIEIKDNKVNVSKLSSLVLEKENE
ncbi:type I pullulanase [Oceanivirga miroungae]|uniref:pullulanase n=1 Tax=Oceanivirga miroungae TaxID=1130046 RepID=A0A6I8MF26_9FUSO|nr:type I pullulanase [Oceanivirga miroungae]VWL85873.1 Pullulanase [Oceanivirga miroungae]